MVAEEKGEEGDDHGDLPPQLASHLKKFTVERKVHCLRGVAYSWAQLTNMYFPLIIIISKTLRKKYAISGPFSTRF